MLYRAWSSMCQQKADMQEPTYSQGTITPVMSSSPITYRSTEPCSKTTGHPMTSPQLNDTHNNVRICTLQRGRLLMFQQCWLYASSSEV